MSDSTHTRHSNDEHHSEHARQMIHMLLKHFETTEKQGDSTSLLLQHVLVQSETRTLVIDGAETLCPEHLSILRQISQQEKCQLLIIRGG